MRPPESSYFGINTLPTFVVQTTTLPAVILNEVKDLRIPSPRQRAHRREMPQYGYTYILASKGKRLYVGITTRLEHRVRQHKTKADPQCFTAKYNINQFVYFERHPLITAAIAREKQIKGWLRIRKIALIVEQNPTWNDLSLEWGQPVGALQWTPPQPRQPKLPSSS